MRALRKLQRENGGSFVFVSERGTPFTKAGFARMLERAAEAAGIDIKVHPHMLRHACGFALANRGHDTRALQAYLGVTAISSTRALHGISAAPLPGLLEGLKPHHRLA